LAEEGVTLDALKERIREMKFVPGMATLLQTITQSTKENPWSKLVIISDANDLFIKTCLSNLSPPVVPDEIITNPSVISQDKPFLQISPYENQTSCPICPKNLCKGTALKKYIQEHGPFTKVFYVGDGANDLCPALVALSTSDLLFVREGYSLSKILKQGLYKGIEAKTPAEIIYFDNANVIAENMLF
jgi:2,3-diketo-5-methylthio-1-phosphopentane phosphatase